MNERNAHRILFGIWRISSRAQIQHSYCTAATSKFSHQFSCLLALVFSLPFCHFYLDYHKSHWAGNSLNSTLDYTLKLFRQNSNFIKLLQRILSAVLQDRYIFFLSILDKKFLEQIFPEPCCTENKIHLFSLIIFVRNVAIYMILLKIILNW